MEERLQKIISASGLCSRRKAEELISAGKVLVNGNVAILGEKADADTDIITVDGQLLPVSQNSVYVMLNKPRGYVCTLSDEKGRKKVTDLVDVKERLYPIGRLDINSEGLLLLTNDGEFANRVMHPSEEVSKTYELRVRGDDIRKQIAGMREPIVIEGYKTREADVQLIERKGNEALISVTIHEGRNHQVRRLCERSGLQVVSLKRVSEGPLTLGTLKCGSWRYLTNEEVRLL